MASSSHKTHKYRSLFEDERVVGEDAEEQRDWLELGLGFSSSNGKRKQQELDQSSPVSISTTALASTSSTLNGLNHQQNGLGLGLRLGLGLGFDDKKSSVSSVDHEAAPLSNHNHNRLWVDLDHDRNYDLEYDDMPSWPWPLHMDSSCFLDWQMPVFNDSHDYSTRRRPHPGLWFTLISCTNRVGIQALPQIPRAYIRVKDENVTIFMVKKYLVRKLGLSNEAEIDILCMGQSLLQTQTLKQVRDAVWLPRMIESVNSTTLVVQNSEDSSINHLMPLHYGRRCMVLD